MFSEPVFWLLILPIALLAWGAAVGLIVLVCYAANELFSSK